MIRSCFFCDYNPFFAALQAERAYGIIHIDTGAKPALAAPCRLATVSQISAAARDGERAVMQTRPGAQVIAPFDGVVLFAGPFKGYGNLLIIEHGDGYHSLLSGLERLDVGVGQNVLTGEPVGIMSTEGPQKLYIEFRKEGQPVNPGSWFASKKK